MIGAASGLTIYGGVVASLALMVATLSLGWNIVNSIRERRSRRFPDVHAVLVVDAKAGCSQLSFMNAGHGIARSLFYLLVEAGTVYQGATRTPFLGHEERTLSREQFPVAGNASSAASTFVWAYMDSDHNVHAHSNHGDRYTYDHPAHVEIGEAFQRLYPGVELPRRQELPFLGSF